MELRMNSSRSIAVVGVSGYVGCELARLLLRHQGIEQPVFYLRQNGVGDPTTLADLFPQLRGLPPMACQRLDVEAIAAGNHAAVLLATPPEASLELVPQLRATGQRVIDLSGAFRFRAPETFSHWYKLPPATQALLETAVYGLPELYASSLPCSQLVANPGCYATSVILGLRPLVESGWLAAGRGIVCDCKSGASGAGKNPRSDLHFVEVEGNFRAYNLFAHRHTPEVVEHLGLAPEHIIFSTHLLPVSRGILSTLYVWLDESRDPEELEALYSSFYADRPFIRIWPAGQLPELQHVVNTNFCDIGFALDASRQRAIIIACLDNLGKGAAGQAVQNLNLMLGYPEEIGLQ